MTHDYHPSPDTPNLYEVVVTITNTSGGAAISDVRYRRVMDWDIEPTPFFEYVTMVPGTSPELTFTSNDGFASANPLSGPADLGFTGHSTTPALTTTARCSTSRSAGLRPAPAGRSRRSTAGPRPRARLSGRSRPRGSRPTRSASRARTQVVTAAPNTFMFAFGQVGGAPIFCTEDGLALLGETGIASAGTVHESVEPLVDGISPDLAALLHDINCDIVVPLEDDIDNLLGANAQSNGTTGPQGGNLVTIQKALAAKLAAVKAALPKVTLLKKR